MQFKEVISFICSNWKNVMISKTGELPFHHCYYDYDIFEKDNKYYLTDNDKSEIVLDSFPISCREIDENIYEIKYETYTITLCEIA